MELFLFFYPRTNMSLDFSPVKISSSSRTTSSVFQMITLSSNLAASKNTRNDMVIKDMMKHDIIMTTNQDFLMKS